jgi:hypothetical protein
MKIIYEQGDVVYNLNNFTYGIVLAEYDDVPKIIELSKDTFINNVPKGALQYKGHIDITKALKKIVDDIIHDHPTKEGGAE